MSNRVTTYAQLPTGARCLGLTVNGIRVLLTPENEAQQPDTEALAVAISALGPELAPLVPEPEPMPVIPTKSTFVPAEKFTSGQRVWCKVHGAEGYYIVTQVGDGRNHGRIKVSGELIKRAGERMWCPAGNFSAKGPEWSK
jgi:hypothetical protein